MIDLSSGFLNWGESEARVNNLLTYFIDDKTMRALMYNCLRVDIADNNDKAKIVANILGPDFEEIGTGTNRIALLHNSYIVKVALDRRGLADNFAEFKRSAELEKFVAKTYESNYLVNICEYVELFDPYKFHLNERPILQMLNELSKNYLFDDIGFTEKNYCNWGQREAILSSEEKDFYGDDSEYAYNVCILDYGYLYPIADQKDNLMRCPMCHHKLAWNGNFTGLTCTSSNCKFSTTPMNLRRMMKLDMEDFENDMVANFNSLKMPNLSNIEKSLSKVHKNMEEKA